MKAPFVRNPVAWRATKVSPQGASGHLLGLRGQQAVNDVQALAPTAAAGGVVGMQDAARQLAQQAGTQGHRLAGAMASMQEEAAAGPGLGGVSKTFNHNPALEFDPAQRLFDEYKAGILAAAEQSTGRPSNSRRLAQQMAG